MKVVILDTGCANLASVAYAVKRLGYDPIISYEKNVVLSADKLFTRSGNGSRKEWNNWKHAN